MTPPLLLSALLPKTLARSLSQLIARPEPETPPSPPLPWITVAFRCRREKNADRIPEILRTGPARLGFNGRVLGCAVCVAAKSEEQVDLRLVTSAVCGWLSACSRTDSLLAVLQ